MPHGRGRSGRRDAVIGADRRDVRCGRREAGGTEPTGRSGRCQERRGGARPAAAGSTLGSPEPEEGITAAERATPGSKLRSPGEADWAFMAPEATHDPELAVPCATSSSVAPMGAETSGIAGWRWPHGHVPAMVLDGAAGYSRGSSLRRAGEISCDRPGCYEQFVRTRRSPAQRFCARPCRRAMERVWQREARWQARHGLGSPRHAAAKARDGPEVLNRM
jgi:hypothetical protein